LDKKKKEGAKTKLWNIATTFFVAREDLQSVN
jgi:hypothetical protein